MRTETGLKGLGVVVDDVIFVQGLRDLRRVGKYSCGLVIQERDETLQY